jgi:methylenetetrahydrofolate--tRNA-(uracil-5-)-methyltransferase
MTEPLTIIGAGLSGSEAAWQAAELGVDVKLYEMRPLRNTEAHQTHMPAELVCSNSLGSTLVDRPSGLLKEEMRRLGSLLLKLADESAVPAGRALAVDREVFSALVEKALESHPRIDFIREEVTEVPDGPAVLASGPLTSPDLADSLAKLTGSDHLFFFDAISPIVEADSIDMDIAYRAERYNVEDETAGDYINCPFDRDQYAAFVEALATAERIPLHEFESSIETGVKGGWHKYFEGCLPVEIIASRGPDSLAFGPMRPVGLRDPRSGKRSKAILQLRQDNVAGTLYNLVGFQTNLKFGEQKRVFSMIPGLENAEFARYGMMHRNTFLAAPQLLNASLQFKDREDLFCAGQLTGIEGYAGNIASGWLAGANAARHLQGEPLLEVPRQTMLGALCHYIANADLADFQPMKSNFGLFDRIPDGKKLGKRGRAERHSQNALEALENWRELL